MSSLKYWDSLLTAKTASSDILLFSWSERKLIQNIHIKFYFQFIWCPEFQLWIANLLCQTPSLIESVATKKSFINLKKYAVLKYVLMRTYKTKSSCLSPGETNWLLAIIMKDSTELLEKMMKYDSPSSPARCIIYLDRQSRPPKIL